MGYELHVYPHHGREIDFLAQKGNQRYYVQVAYSVQDDKAFQRECKAFESLGDPLSQRVLITTDELDYSTSTVRHIPLSRFLLLDEL
jgi:predicted AAA+ superfamily ATPase